MPFAGAWSVQMGGVGSGIGSVVKSKNRSSPDGQSSLYPLGLSSKVSVPSSFSIRSKDDDPSPIQLPTVGANPPAVDSFNPTSLPSHSSHISKRRFSISGKVKSNLAPDRFEAFIENVNLLGSSTPEMDSVALSQS